MTFIKLRQKGNSGDTGLLNVNINKIYMYGQYYSGGSFIMFDGSWDNHWTVEETPEQIEELIKGINNGT